MDYYRRYNPDGSCIIICTHCFATLGAATGADQIAALECRHVCGEAVAPRVPPEPISAPPVSAPPGDSKQIRKSGVAGSILPALLDKFSPRSRFLLAAFFLYGLPTVAEMALRHRFSPWIIIIAFGDLTGSLCLALLLRMPLAALLLYAGLTLSEACMYLSGFVRVHTLVWIVDLVPTLIVAFMLARLRSPHSADPPHPALL